MVHPNGMPGFPQSAETSLTRDTFQNATEPLLKRLRDSLDFHQDTWHHPISWNRFPSLLQGGCRFSAAGESRQGGGAGFHPPKRGSKPAPPSGCFRRRKTFVNREPFEPDMLASLCFLCPTFVNSRSFQRRPRWPAAPVFEAPLAETNSPVTPGESRPGGGVQVLPPPKRAC